MKRETRMSLKTKALTETLDRVPHVEALTVDLDILVGAALGLMRLKNVSCLVISQDKKPVGIFTERDFLTKVFGEPLALNRPISDFMTAHPRSLLLSQSVGDAVELMNGLSLRHIPVLDEKGILIFVITVDGVMRYLADHFPAAVMNRPPELRKIASETDGA